MDTPKQKHVYGTAIPSPYVPLLVQVALSLGGYDLWQLQGFNLVSQLSLGGQPVDVTTSVDHWGSLGIRGMYNIW